MANLPIKINLHNYLPDGVNPNLEIIEKLNKNLYYKDYYFTVSEGEITKFYSLILIYNKKIEFEINGTGLKFMINPGISNSTEIPVKFRIRSPYKKYFPDFNIKTFDISFREVFIYMIRKLKIEKMDALVKCFEIFEINSNKFATFINKVNTEFSVNIDVNQLDQSNLFSDLIYKIEIENSLELYFVLFQVYISNSDLSIFYDNIELFANQSGISDKFKPKNILEELLPFFEIEISKIAIGASLPIKYFREVDENTNLPIINNETGKYKESIISYNAGSIIINSRAQIKFNPSSTFLLPKTELFNSGIILKFNDLKLEMDDNNSKSLFSISAIKSNNVTVILPKFTDNGSNCNIKANNVYIGNSGFTGDLFIDATEGINDAPLLKLKLGQDFNISLDTFSITFQQSSIVNSLIKGKLTIPGVKQKNEDGTYSSIPVQIDINAFIGNNGEFKINAQPVGGLSFFIENVARIDITSLSLGKENDKYYISIAGALDFSELAGKINGVESDFPTNIPLKKLKIWEDGKMEFDAGIITMPKAISLKIGPAKLAVTSLLFSSTELYHNGKKRQYGVIGFDGSLDIKPGGVSVKGEGVKIYYTTDNKTDVSESSPEYRPLHIFLRIEGIGLEITVPSDASISEADFYLKGRLAIKNPEGEGETMKSYAGQIAFSINKAKIAGSATMDYNPNIPQWLIDAKVSVPAGIPMGSTGLAIYGFKGLAGKNKRFDKNDEETWWKLYKRPEEGINKSKFKTGKGLAVGLGVSLASQTDNGRPFSSVLVLMLGLPDVIMLQGQAAFMRDRVQFGEKDPPFSALLSIDKHSVQAGLGVKYSISENIAKLNGEAEMAYFWKNSKSWYINFGKDTPDNARITARIFSLFDAYAYLMISASGMKMGAGAKWEFTKKLGPVGLGANAYIDTYGRISFKPQQIGGGIAIGGNAYANLSKFKFGFSLAAYLEAEAPKPFQIKGGVDVKLELPKPMKSKGLHLEFAWILDTEKYNSALPILETLTSEGKVVKPAKAINMLTSESYDVMITLGDKPNTATEELPIIPVDSFIDIAFSNSPKAELSNSIVIGGTSTGIENKTLVPPQKGLSEQVKHEFELNSVNIFAYDNSAWQPYNVFEASNVIKQLPNVAAQLATNANYLKTLPQAYWQSIDANKNTQLRIMGQNMFSYLNQTHLGSIETERLGYEGGVVFCEQTKIANKCIDWENEAVNSLYLANKTTNKDGVKIIVYGKDGEVKTISNSFNLTNGLEFSEVEGLELQFSEPQSVVKPKLKVSSGNVLHVEYITKVTNELDHNNLPVYKFQSIQTDKLTATQLTSYEGYASENVPVFKVKITFERTGMLNANHTSPLRIGYSSSPSSWQETSNSLIVIDEVAIIGKGTSSEEIDWIYNNGYTGGNIIAEWHLNGNGNDAVNNYDGIAINNPYSITGRNGSLNNAYHLGKLGFLGGSNARYFEVPHANELSIGKDNFTISTWVKLPPNSHSFKSFDDYWYVGRKAIVSKMKKGDGGFDLAIQGWKQHGTNIQKTGVSFQFKLDNTNGYISDYFVECNDLMDGNWHHVLVTKTNEDYSGSSQPHLNIWVDGSWLYSEAFYIPLQAPSGDNASIHSLCTLSQEKHQFNLSIPSQQTLNEQNNKMLDGLTKIVQPIWRPNTKYAIEVKGKDNVDGTANEQTFTILFQTKGATGHFVKENTTQDADNFLLGNIKGYIDYKHSFPNAEGKLLNSKPLFYKTPSIHLFYNTPYMNLMFESWKDSNQNELANYNLTLQVKDAKASQDNALAVQPMWSTVIEKVENQDIAMLNNLLNNGTNCWGHNEDMTRIMHKTEYILPNLIPNNLYSATYFSKNILDNNIQDAEVHKHVFQTSKYGNFKEQIESFSKTFTETVKSIQLNENFNNGNGGFSAHTGSSLTLSNRLYVESASHPSVEISINVVEKMLYTVSFDFVGASFNAGGNTNIYCLVDGKKLYTNTSINTNGDIQNLTYSFESSVTDTITLTIVLENNNIGKLEYLIIDNFNLFIPPTNGLLISEDFDNGSNGGFNSNNGSIVNVIGTLLRIENINDPRCTKIINVFAGVSYTITFQIINTSSNGGNNNIRCTAGLSSFMMPLLGLPLPQTYTFTFVSPFTGTLPIEIGFDIPTTLGTVEFIEIDDFEINYSSLAPINILYEEFNSSTNNFIASQFSSLTMTNKLYVESLNAPNAKLNFSFEENSNYTLSFDVLGKSYNAGNDTVVCTINTLASETIPISVGSNYSINFNTTEAKNVQLSFSLPSNNSGALEYLIIGNVKLISTKLIDIVLNSMYAIEKSFDAGSIQKAINIITDNNSQDAELVSKFNLKYDRLLNGALTEIGALQAPVDTEIIKIINTSDNNKLLGFVIRNPEPIFNPSLETVDLNTSLVVERHFGSNQVDNNFKLIYSKDKSNIFVTKDNLELTSGEYKFKFKHLEYNGSAYVLKAPSEDNQITLTVTI